MGRTHYSVLGVAPDATVEAIEHSFRQLARRLHPDLNGGDGAAVERMKELNIARAALTDPAARAAYDEELRYARRAAEAPPPPAPGARAPTPTGAGKPLVPPPVVSWMRTPEAPAPPVATPEISRMASVGRVVWIGLAALLALVIVVALIWLREALDGGS